MIYSKHSLDFLPLWSRFWELWANTLKSRLQLNRVPVHETHSAKVRKIPMSSKTPSNDLHSLSLRSLILLHYVARLMKRPPPHLLPLPPPSHTLITVVFVKPLDCRHCWRTCQTLLSRTRFDHQLHPSLILLFLYSEIVLYYPRLLKRITTAPSRGRFFS
jgi:hypothetical protein